MPATASAGSSCGATWARDSLQDAFVPPSGGSYTLVSAQWESESRLWGQAPVLRAGTEAHVQPSFADLGRARLCGSGCEVGQATFQIQVADLEGGGEQDDPAGPTSRQGD